MFQQGVARDVLIGDLPPRLVRTEGLLLVPIVAALAILAAPNVADRLRHPVLLLDAVGLGLFAAVGASRAVDAGLGIGATVLVGTVSAVGGGLVRDLLADQIPEILAEGSRLYAVPAALGALLVLMLPGAAWSQGLPNATPEDVGLSSQKLARVTEAVKGEIARGRYPGAVALVASNTLV